MKRRLAAILAALALVLTTLVSTATTATAASPAGEFNVALGDSVAAGTGLLPYADQACARSAGGYPMLLAASQGSRDVWSSACSGATSQDVIDHQLGDLGPRTTVVSLTAGINNTQWVNYLVACSQFGSAAQCVVQQQVLGAALAALPSATAQLVAAVQQKAPSARIVVTGYPRPFGTFATSCTIGMFGQFPVAVSAIQAAQLNGLVDQVNLGIRAGAASVAPTKDKAAISFVDVTAAFTGHGLCDVGAPYVNGLVQLPFEASLHPNAGGQQAYAAAVGAVVTLK
ncbi:SGNH/GDSL hydrolase family protein [Propionibacteriaceae bacterium G1746]|uniref:SGNH/GDSL hydrolase family protein n=1 Tax=Aestuariimicrobium sp. G57 TaxID=3418485 RepID=UPI003C1B0810